jgi:hypothetical protein
MLVEREIDLPRRDAVDFEVKGVTTAPGADVFLAACGHRKRSAGEAKGALGGVLRGPGEVVGLGAVHRESCSTVEDVFLGEKEIFVSQASRLAAGVFSFHLESFQF